MEPRDLTPVCQSMLHGDTSNRNLAVVLGPGCRKERGDGERLQLATALESHKGIAVPMQFQCPADPSGSLQESQRH